MFSNTVLIGTLSTFHQCLEHNHFIVVQPNYRIENNMFLIFGYHLLLNKNKIVNFAYCFSFAKEPTRTYISWYFVGPNLFLVGTSWSNIFSRVYFVGPTFFLVSISWVQFFFSWLISWFISNHVFYSKPISTTVSSVYIREVFHLLNYLSYYAAFTVTNSIFGHLFSPVLGSFTRNNNSYCKTTCTIVSLLISCLLILRIPFLKKTPL